MRILSEQSILVVVDIQERLFPHIHDNQSLSKKCATLIEGAKILGLPIVVTEQYTKGLGYTIKPISEVLGISNTIEKMDFSCCGEGKFMLKIEEHFKDNVILCGIESHVCVLQTAIDLLERGHQPIVIADAVSSRNLYDKEIALKRMENEGVMLSTVESILLEMCRVSGTDSFKAISRLIK